MCIIPVVTLVYCLRCAGIFTSLPTFVQAFLPSSHWRCCRHMGVIAIKNASIVTTVTQASLPPMHPCCRPQSLGVFANVALLTSSHVVLASSLSPRRRLHRRCAGAFTIAWAYCQRRVGRALLPLHWHGHHCMGVIVIVVWASSPSLHWCCAGICANVVLAEPLLCCHLCQRCAGLAFLKLALSPSLHWRHPHCKCVIAVVALASWPQLRWHHC
jgi:hypothetical protein